MDTNKKDALKNKIRDALSMDYSGFLDKNLDFVKQLFRITKDGKIDVIVKDSVTGEQKIALYLVGKLYAKESELSITDEVDNSELMTQLGIRKGSLLPWLKSLRDSGVIHDTKIGKKTYHSIHASEMERVLKEIDKSLKRRIE